MKNQQVILSYLENEKRKLKEQEEKLDSAIEVVRSLATNPAEVADLTIGEAAAIYLRRVQQPQTCRQVVQGLTEGGFGANYQAVYKSLQRQRKRGELAYARGKFSVLQKASASKLRPSKEKLAASA